MSIQAMKQALEALNRITCVGRHYGPHGLSKLVEDAESALRAAIAEQEKVEPVAMTGAVQIGNTWYRTQGGYLMGEIPPQPAPAWQPIETAPRDGTVILLCRVHPNPDVRIAVSDGQWLETRNGHWDWVWPYIRKEPTHWMPLPAAPKPTDGE